MTTGFFVRSHIGGNDHGLQFPTGFVFLPGWTDDCNLNHLPDSCDVAQGGDANGNRIPDECDIDCNNNGVFDRLDIVPYGREPDCNFNLSPDACDIAQDAALDTNGNGIIDGCECFDFRACADANGDGIRDDGCVWWTCESGTCVDTNVHFGDVGGALGACPVDGVPDGNDHFHALNCFANDVDGMPYPCAIDPPNALNIDLGGALGSCIPDGLCDGHDAFHALEAFGRVSPCTCPLDGGPSPSIMPLSGGTAGLETRLRNTEIHPGEQVLVDIYLLATPQALRGYQLHVGASGGQAGRLAVVDIAVDPTLLERRGPDVSSPWVAFNVPRGQMLVGVSTGTLQTPHYLATFTFEASPDAVGHFVIDVLADHTDPQQRTFLFSATPAKNIVVTTTPATVRITERASRIRSAAKRSLHPD